MSAKPTRQSRREFLSNAPRLILLAALATLTGKLAQQTGGPTAPARHQCVGGNLCRHCPALDDCVLPLAQSYRNHPHGGKPA